MKASSQALVRDTLAAYLARAVETIDDHHRLGRDLGLDPLDLVLVALKLEARAPQRGEFPVEALATDMTVAHLEALHRAWRYTEERIEDIPDTLRVPYLPPSSHRAGERGPVPSYR